MADSQKSVESEAYSAFKRVRNKLRKFSQKEILLALIKILNQQHLKNQGAMRECRPWHLLLLIKWTLKFGNPASPDRRPLTRSALDKILASMDDFTGNVRLPADDYNGFLLSRNYAFQQFWLLQRHDYSRFARQSILFSHLSDKHPLARCFLECARVSIKNFVELALCLFEPFWNREDEFITGDFFNTVRSSYPPGSIERFLDMLSLDVNGVSDYLRKLEPRPRSVLYPAFGSSCDII